MQIYYLGIISIGLLLAFLASIASVMAVSGRNMLDKEVIRKEEELKQQDAETCFEATWKQFSNVSKNTSVCKNASQKAVH